MSPLPPPVPRTPPSPSASAPTPSANPIIELWDKMQRAGGWSALAIVAVIIAVFMAWAAIVG